ncbi:MAG: biotin/lipoyl-binding protein [Planctomycetes bacterium]|nr:biotin/lipoyl-binding protein [Planctomycetota bacterium]
MSQEHVLRGKGKDAVVRLVLAPDGQLTVADAKGHPGQPRALRVLRRESNGLVVALWGDEIVHGVVRGENAHFALWVGGGPGLEGLTLKPAAIDALEQAAGSAGAHSGPLEIASPIPGTIKAVRVKPGDAVEEGQTVVVLEAMKMENEIPAPHAGTVESVAVQAGQTVAAGAALLKIKT